MTGLANACSLWRPALLGAALLVVGIAAVYGQVYQFGFAELDDRTYVIENQLLRLGFTPEGLRLALTSNQAANFHPLTMLSLMLDFQLFGLDPGKFHLVNVLLHTVSAVLLYLALLWMTRAPWCSGFVAGAFAFHPQQVETVAWIAERKGALSAVFWMAALLAYAWHVQRPSWFRMSCVAVSMALGLLAKGALVTFPFALLLLDFWPLRRMAREDGNGIDVRNARRMVVEKLPLFALTVFGCILVYWGQSSGGAVRPLEIVPSEARLSTACVNYFRYLSHFVWPAGLAPYYPLHAEGPPLWQAIAAGIGLCVMTALAVAAWRRWPYVTVGWLWYVGVLVPVIGLIPLGAHAFADRYTYLPMIGLVFILAWGVADYARGRERMQKSAACAGAVLLVVWGGLAFRQAGFWRDGETLFRHTLAVTENNHPAHHTLGNILLRKGELNGAATHFQEAVRLAPNSALAHNNMGTVYGQLGDLDKALIHFQQAIRIDPEYATGYANIGNVYMRQSRLQEAYAAFQKAHSLMTPLNPQYARTTEMLGQLERMQRLQSGP